MNHSVTWIDIEQLSLYIYIYSLIEKVVPDTFYRTEMELLVFKLYPVSFV